MIKIAHRGNYAGINTRRENTISYITEALNAGYWAEVDVQMLNGVLYLGHDNVQEIAPESLLTNTNVICHAKDLQALHQLHILNSHVFWHDKEPICHTSKGLIWCYPGVHIRHENAIWLDLNHEPLPKDLSGIFGLCSDNFADVYSHQDFFLSP